MRTSHGLSGVKTPPHPTRSFTWEITGALLVKFALLTGLWWLFFAGHKQLITETTIANKIFDAPTSLPSPAKPQEQQP